MTRGHRDWLGLRHTELASATICRSPGARRGFDDRCYPSPSLAIRDILDASARIGRSPRRMRDRATQRLRHLRPSRPRVMRCWSMRWTPSSRACAMRRESGDRKGPLRPRTFCKHQRDTAANLLILHWRTVFGRGSPVPTRPPPPPPTPPPRSAASPTRAGLTSSRVRPMLIVSSPQVLPVPSCTSRLHPSPIFSNPLPAPARRSPFDPSPCMLLEAE
jgi:hypothetical protein